MEGLQVDHEEEAHNTIIINTTIKTDIYLLLLISVNVNVHIEAGVILLTRDGISASIFVMPILNSENNEWFVNLDGYLLFIFFITENALSHLYVDPNIDEIFKPKSTNFGYFSSDNNLKNSCPYSFLHRITYDPTNFLHIIYQYVIIHARQHLNRVFYIK